MQSAGKDDTGLVIDCLRRLVHGLRVSSHAAEHDLGVTGAQLFVLRELATEPGISIRRLSERTLTDASSVSVVVARLVENGFVKRRRDELDARRSVLVLSKKGEALLQRAPTPYQEHLIAALREMPAARVRSLGQMLSELVGAVAPARGAAPLFFEERPKKRARSRRVEKK